MGLNLGKLVTGGMSLPKLLSRPRLRVLDPGEDKRYHDLDEQADRILAKLHREGEGSLTAKERRLLEAYSRRVRQKRR
jgi:hypothetical protein